MLPPAGLTAGTIKRITGNRNPNPGDRMENPGKPRNPGSTLREGPSGDPHRLFFPAAAGAGFVSPSFPFTWALGRTPPKAGRFP